MTPPNMAAITASLERSLQNCSLNHHQVSSSDSSNSNGPGGGLGFGRSASSESPEIRHHLSNSSDTTLELNSHISLPYHWEQCLDLKTGEVYYINWRTGMKAKEDPRTSNEFSGDFYSEEEDNSEGSSTESSPSSSRVHHEHNHHRHQENQRGDEREREQQVLVVAGCKSCLMYFMVPKQVEDCPKCTGQLLHFDRSDDSGTGTP